MQLPQVACVILQDYKLDVFSWPKFSPSIFPLYCINNVILVIMLEIIIKRCLC